MNSECLGDRKPLLGSVGTEQVATVPGLEWEPEELDLCSDGGGSRGRFGTENKVT